MEQEYTIKFSGELKGAVTGKHYKWSERVPFTADSRDMVNLNPNMYETRPLLPTRTTQLTATVPIRIESAKNGWHTLFKGKTRVFSSRDIDEVLNEKAKYVTH